MATYHVALCPQGDCLRPVTDSPIAEEFLEVGTHRPKRDAQAFRDLLVGQTVSGKGKDLSLATGKLAGKAVDPAIPTGRAAATEITHRFITRCLENIRATLSCAYLKPKQRP